MNAFETETAFVHRVLDSIETRAKVAMHNIANQNTPGFKRYRVQFSDLLKEARSEGRPTGEVHAKVTQDESGPPNQNNVDLLDEFREMEEVKYLQSIFLMRASGYFSHIRSATTGRI